MFGRTSQLVRIVHFQMDSVIAAARMQSRALAPAASWRRRKAPTCARASAQAREVALFLVPTSRDAGGGSTEKKGLFENTDDGESGG